MIASFLVALAFGSIDPSMVPRFTVSEAAAVRRWWADPSRYQVNDQMSASEGGPYTVAPTVEGSVWLLAYYKAFFPGQPILPDRPPVPTTPSQRRAAQRIEARFQEDWSLASKDAAALNQGLDPAPTPPGDRLDGLSPTLGPAPRFAQAFRAKRYTVVFPDATVFASDNVKLDRGFPYLRATDGIDVPGFANGAGVWEAALMRVGATGDKGKVLQAVSGLEGGFDCVNTYDTGRVSVGVVQFASMADGSGSLGSLLRAFKRDDPSGFQVAFRRYGVDVTSSGVLAVLDPATGCEVQGQAAVRRIQADKRLTAVFVRAGRVSAAFRGEQIHMALAMFWPGDRVVDWQSGGRRFSARLGEVFRSQAGMATVMDRLVNTGDVSAVLAVVRDRAVASGAKGAADLSNQESRLIRELRYRQDFMLLAGLTKPTELVASASATPPPFPGTTLRPLVPGELRPIGGPPAPQTPSNPKSDQPGDSLPEGADPKVAIPLGPPPEQRKPEDFISKLKQKPVDEGKKVDGG